VNLRGGITYDGIPVTTLVQFLVNENTDRFEISAMEINDLPQNLLMAIGLLNNMCEA